MNETPIYDLLYKIYQEAPTIDISDQDRLVIFSDLHAGNGKSRDDFLQNAHFMMTILEKYYLKNSYKLILNGDVEELLRFSLPQITRRWKGLYQLFEQFCDKTSFYKILGNHDQLLSYKKKSRFKDHLYQALRLNYHGDHLFVFHGHQASFYLENFAAVVRFILRYIANPIGIKNHSYSRDNKIRFKTEKRVYSFSRTYKIISLIGHTHRPLFESMSKVDYLKFKIEQLCWDYLKTPENEKPALALRIKTYNHELQDLLTRHIRDNSNSSLYHPGPLVPCMFNSGCTIAKKGITALEITNGEIALINWFDQSVNQKYLKSDGHHQPEQLENTDYFRVVLNQNPLNYIFTRIKLLA